MSEVQGSTAAQTADGSTTQSNNQPAANHQPVNGGSSGNAQGKDGVQPSNAVDGKSATGSPDVVDKAAAAIQQGRELSEKEQSILVTRIVNGQKVTRKIGEWIGASQLEQASHQRFQQANQMMQQATQIVNSFKSNPAAFMKNAGIDPDDFAKAHLSQQLEMLGMSEEQRELYQLREEKKSREDRDKFEAQQKQQQDQQSKDTNEYNSMVKESLEAWKESGLPDDEYFGQRMAAQIMKHQAQGIPLTWKEAASIVKHEWTTSTQRVLGNFQSVEELANYLGEPVLKKLRQYEVARVTSRQASKTSSQRPGNSNPASQKTKQPTYLNDREYSDWWAKKSAEHS